jgi:histidine triad (HIT) family protein
VKTCLFCQIARGELPAHPVYDAEHALAFLDKSPVFKGHVLVVPRPHVETLTELPVAAIGPLFESVQVIARAVERALSADGTFVAMNNRVSQSVPHLHVHVVPRKKKDGLRGFFWPRQKYDSDAEMAEIARAIATHLDWKM